MRIDIYHHFDPGSPALDRFEKLLNKLGLIVQGETKLMSDITDALDKAEAAAAANSAVDDSAEALLKTLADLVASLKTQTTDPATVQRINDLATALNERSGRLGVAISSTPST